MKQKEKRIRNERPSRREFIKRTAAASLGAVALGGSGCVEPTVRTPADFPNILWITCEDMSPALGCYGDKYARTPNLDRLARESVRYTRAFATAPVCSPVRSCLITGVFATSMGTQNLRSAFPVPLEIRGFPSYLREAGYYTTNNVKTDYNTSDERRIIESSWDDCSRTAHWRNRGENQPFFSVFNDVTTHQSRTMVWPYEKFKKEVQSRLDPSEIHDPDEAPVPPYYPDTPIVRRTIARFYDCMTVMDKNVGKLLDQLEKDGLAENTIVFFYSDHGSGLPRHKRLLYDSGLRVPLLIRFPEKFRHLAPAPPGSTVNRLVSFVDFPPTVLTLAGLTPPSYMQGKPFLGRAGLESGPRIFVAGARDRVDEAYDLARSVRDENFLYIRNFMPHLSYNQPSWYSDQGEIRQEITRLEAEGKLETPAQKAYAGPTRPLEELYDTEKDPFQIRNLAADPKYYAVVARMRRRLKYWIRKTHDIGFLPECEVARRCEGRTPYEIARDENLYPQKRIVAAAELVGTGEGSLSKQTALLKDDDAGVRYWATVGLHALGEKARPAAKALAELPAG